MGSRGLLWLGLEALLVLSAGIWSCAWAHAAATSLTDGRLDLNAEHLCGWIGIGVKPITPAFAASLRMVEPYGAIFGEPQPGSPAATAQIEQGDVLTSVNGVPLMQAHDFAGLISRMAPRTTVYLYTWRNGQPRPVQVILGSAACEE